MAGNFVAGLVWGGLVAGLGLAVISPMAPLLGPEMDKVAAEKPAEEEKPEEVKTAEAVPVKPDPAKIEPAPEPEPAPELVVKPVPEPVTSPAPVADPTKDAILLPAQPEVAAAPVPPESPAVPDATAAAALEPTQPMVEPVQPQPATPEAAPMETATKEVAPAETVDAAPMPIEAAEAPAVVETAPAVTPEAGTAPLESAAPEPEVAVAPVDPAAGVTTNRLPAIGKTTEAPATGAAPAGSDNADATPLTRYARPFENLTGNPPMAILLIDDGSDGIDRAALAALPFPVTFVLDPLAFNAPEAAAIYRAAGQEVAMLATGIPEGANASDLEQTFQTHDAVLPEAVAYVDLAKGGFQGDRPLATEVVTTLAPRGRGLVTYDEGLNAADQVAQRSGMPSAVIVRILDSEGESAPVVRRYLDRVAFKAAQEGGAIVIGQARPETVAGLIEWSVEGRSSAVSIAPLSVLLLAGR